MTPEEKAEFMRRRKGRNIALGLVLGGFVLLFYLITIVRVGD
ncbi:hypothetical protein [Altererythrobacter sp. KTW20L]|nr:hypothetical protein [Altererythrobacter sp. KTW20L]